MDGGAVVGMGMVGGGDGGAVVERRRVIDSGRQRETAGDGRRRWKFAAACVPSGRLNMSRRH